MAMQPKHIKQWNTQELIDWMGTLEANQKNQKIKELYVPVVLSNQLTGADIVSKTRDELIAMLPKTNRLLALKLKRKIEEEANKPEPQEAMIDIAPANVDEIPPAAFSQNDVALTEDNPFGVPADEPGPPSYNEAMRQPTMLSEGGSAPPVVNVVANAHHEREPGSVHELNFNAQLQEQISVPEAMNQIGANPGQAPVFPVQQQPQPQPQVHAQPVQFHPVQQMDVDQKQMDASSWRDVMINHWTCDMVASWMATLPSGIQKFKPVVVDEKRMTGQELMDLSDDQWAELIPKKLVRNAFRNRLKEVLPKTYEILTKHLIEFEQDEMNLEQLIKLEKAMHDAIGKVRESINKKYEALVETEKKLRG